MHSCLFCLNRCLACRIVRGQAAGSTICSFRMYQSPKFSTVVFTPDELKYWDPSATPCTPFAPTLVHLESDYETHTILGDLLLPVVKKIGFQGLRRRFVNVTLIFEATPRQITQHGSGGAGLLARGRPSHELPQAYLFCWISGLLKWMRVSITLSRLIGTAMNQPLRKQFGWLVTPPRIGEQLTLLLVLQSAAHPHLVLRSN